MRNPEQAAFVARKGIESGGSDRPQLYDLASDIGERSNLAASKPGEWARLRDVLAQIEARTAAPEDRARADW